MTVITPCPCNPQISYQACCQGYHEGAIPRSAAALMRARYSAFVKHNIDFIQASTLPAQQAQLDLDAIKQWSQHSDWQGLEVHSEALASDQSHSHVEFIAHWQDAQGRHQHQETSLFIKPAERWYFYDPNVPLPAKRNDPCPCASGLKFKKCCAAFF